MKRLYSNLTVQVLIAQEAAKFTARAGEMNWVEFFTHMVPDNVVGAFAKGDILQVLLFSVLFGLALNRLGATGQPFDRLSQVMFGVLGLVMKPVPLGAFGGMAFTFPSPSCFWRRPLTFRSRSRSSSR